MSNMTCVKELALDVEMDRDLYLELGDANNRALEDILNEAFLRAEQSLVAVLSSHLDRKLPKMRVTARF